MGQKIKAIDAYIAKAADFAKPILEYFRELVHSTCPEVEEKIKWSYPFFDYRNQIMCNMAAFKNHASIGFWKASLMKDQSEFILTGGTHTMGHIKNITDKSKMPSDKKLVALLKEAMRLNEEGVKIIAKPKLEKAAIEVPGYFTKALAKDKKAKEVFEKFAPSHRKEYLQWITEAKTEETRNKRMKTAIEWISEGKGKNWKYEKKK